MFFAFFWALVAFSLLIGALLALARRDPLIAMLFAAALAGVAFFAP